MFLLCSPPALAASSYSLQVVFVETSVHIESRLNNRKTAKYSKKLFLICFNIYTLETILEKLRFVGEKHSFSLRRRLRLPVSEFKKRIFLQFVVGNSSSALGSC